MLWLVAAIALSQCTKDTDCKGDRICSDGHCVDAMPSDAPKLAPPVPPWADPVRDALLLGQTQQIKSEIAELRAKLDDTTYAAPVVKLVFAALCGAGMLGSLAVAAQPGLSSVGFVGIIGFGAATIVLHIVGGFQLRNRVRDRQTLPLEIHSKEEELKVLTEIVSPPKE